MVKVYDNIIPGVICKKLLDLFEKNEDYQEYINDKTDKELQILLKHMSIKNAVDFLSHSSSIKRNVLYNRAVLLKNKNQ